MIDRGGPATGDVHGKPWQLKEQAVDIVAKQHLDDPRVAYVFDLLAGALPSERAEAFLPVHLPSAGPRHKRGSRLPPGTISPSHSSRPQAFSLLAKKERLMNYERYWTLAVTPYLERNFPYDRERLLAQSERVLNQVANEFADVRVIEWKGEGPGRRFIRPASAETPKTYGELARSLLWSIKNVVPGSRRPTSRATMHRGNDFA